MRRLFSLLASVLALIALCAPAFAADPYYALAKQLSRASGKLDHAAVAVIPFRYLGVSGPAAEEAGEAVAEKLTTELVKLGGLKVIERALLEKILEEHRLRLSGAMDIKEAAQIGGLAGAGAIITGTLQNLRNQKVEINARLIEVKTGAVLAAAGAQMKSEWAQTPGGAAPRESPAGTARRFPEFFADVYGGFAASKADLAFENKRSGLSCAELGLGAPCPAGAQSLSFKDLKLSQNLPPLGVRMGAFDKHLGGALELSYAAQDVDKQNSTLSAGGVAQGSYGFPAERYLRLSALGIAAQIFLRYPSEFIEPYLGFGVGLTLNKITSASVSGAPSAPLDEASLGFMLQAPAGLRLRLGERWAFFTEGRYVYNAFAFDRGAAGEKDTVKLRALQLAAGLSYFW